MSSSASSLNFDACNNFFATVELLELFLSSCSTNVLLNCTLVCRTWSDIINGSQRLQEQLFLQPITAAEGLECRLNPILASHFAPILCPELSDRGFTSEIALSQLESGSSCSLEHLADVRWARNIPELAQTGSAFTRAEASWREMLVSQPPMSRIDWWHEWTHDQPVVGNVSSWLAHIVFNQDRGPPATGWGHQDQSREYVTLGMLWDLVESRATRGCNVRVQYFPHGKAVEEDQYATSEEKHFIAEGDRRRRPYTPTTPRVKIVTKQIWNRVPWSGAGFDVEARQWVTMAQERPTYYAGDGFNTLRADCHYDHSNKPRWSKSDSFRWGELDGEASGN